MRNSYANKKGTILVLILAISFVITIKCNSFVIGQKNITNIERNPFLKANNSLEEIYS